MTIDRSIPLLRVDGVCVGTREVVIPAKEAEEYTTASGEKRTSRPQAERRYWEAGINTAALLYGEVGDLGAVLPVKLPDNVDRPARGDRVSWYVDASDVRVFMGGQFRQWVQHTYRGQVASAAAAVSTPAKAFSVAQ